jgi:signal peptidase I
VRRQVIAVAIFLAVVLAFVTVFRVAIVRGDSMLPTYKDGDFLLVNRMTALGGPLARGDVVLIRMGDEVLVKRITHLPGDRLSDFEAFAFRRVRMFFEPLEKTTGREPLAVPAGFVVVVGDNRRASSDSRRFGPVPVGDVLGRVVGAPPRLR